MSIATKDEQTTNDFASTLLYVSALLLMGWVSTVVLSTFPKVLLLRHGPRLGLV